MVARPAGATGVLTLRPYYRLHESPRLETLTPHVSLGLCVRLYLSSNHRRLLWNESIESRARLRRRRPSGGECDVQGGDRTERSNPKDLEQALLARACDAKRMGLMPVCGCVLDAIAVLSMGQALALGVCIAHWISLEDVFVGYRFCTAPCSRVNRGERARGLLSLLSF